MQRSIAKEYFDQREEIKNGYDEIGVLNAKIIYLNRQIQLKELEIKRQKVRNEEGMARIQREMQFKMDKIKRELLGVKLVNRY